MILRSLPPGATPAFLTSLIFGGPLERIHLPTPETAFVTFLHGEDCKIFYRGTGNGLVYGVTDTGRKKFIDVMMGKEVDIVSGKLRDWIDKEFRRCVRATHVDEEITLPEMKAMAMGKGRALERIAESKHQEKGVSCVHFSFTRYPFTCFLYSHLSLYGPLVSSSSLLPYYTSTTIREYQANTKIRQFRIITFTFSRLSDAVTFHGELARDEDWAQCHLSYANDP